MNRQHQVITVLAHHIRMASAKIIAALAIIAGMGIGMYVFWDQNAGLPPLVDLRPTPTIWASAALPVTIPATGDPDDTVRLFLELSAQEQTAFDAEENESRTIVSEDEQAIVEFGQTINEHEF